ncbi:hypothetical protein [Halalkalibacter krulwichiae]|uniref:Uncharacterized protein n=1 Tax=Halalkalibacter krulwichiae TaxID=199441 RepID=A0A1X9MHY8_9BACI|nr:hypothetical protein [Halalkalibacter krulwichiae]ARK32334.1 hypothetical protein BkAM31D_22120 [Halalkalibacter krulwichiae]
MKKFDECRQEEVDVSEGQAMHRAAIDMKVIALTELLVKKGIITEEEVNQSYKEMIDTIEAFGQAENEHKERYVRFLKNFFDVD